jgi:hypothetical protein
MYEYSSGSRLASREIQKKYFCLKEVMWLKYDKLLYVFAGLFFPFTLFANDPKLLNNWKF